MHVSNKEIAKICLSRKPKFRDTKLLLAMKFKQLENLRSIIQAKQEQLSEFAFLFLIFNVLIWLNVKCCLLILFLQQKDIVFMMLGGVSCRR